MSNKPQWLQDHIADLRARQEGKSRKQIVEELSAESEHVFDPATAVPKVHNWIDRGMKMSCEGASHPNHQAWKQRNHGALKPM